MRVHQVAIIGSAFTLNGIWYDKGQRLPLVNDVMLGDKNLAVWLGGEQEEFPVVFCEIDQATLLDKALAFYYAYGATTRTSALLMMRESFDSQGPYEYAKLHRLLVDESGEELAMQFMAAFNDEVSRVY